MEERADVTDKLEELTAVAKQYEEAQETITELRKQLDDYILKVRSHFIQLARFIIQYIYNEVDPDFLL